MCASAIGTIAPAAMPESPRSTPSDVTPPVAAQAMVKSAVAASPAATMRSFPSRSPSGP
ncbi:hypothetical protein D3C83_43610 [compost metagenome]